MTRMSVVRVLLVATGLLIVVPLVADAGVCHPVQTYHAVNHVAVETPTIVQATPAVAVPFPVIVPAFSFQYVPALAAYSQPAQQVQTKASTAPVKQEAGNKEWKDMMRNLLTGDSEDEVVLPKAAKSSEKKILNQGTEKSDINQVITLLQEKCARCHTNPGKGDVSLFSKEGELAPNVGRDTLWYVTKNNKMPPDAEKNPNARLSKDELNLLKNWMLEE